MKKHGLLALLVAFALAWPAGAQAPQPGGPGPTFSLDRTGQRVVRREASGKVAWSTRLEGNLDGVRPPHLLADARRVYLSHGDGVTALDRETGKVLWHSAGPGDRLLVSGDLVLATDCTSDNAVGPEGRWLLARAAATGAEVFRVRLPVKDFDPEAISEVTGLFVVQTHEDPRGRGNTLLIDRKGRVRHRLGREVLGGKLHGEDRVLVTSRDVVRLSPDGKVVWSVAFARAEWPADGGLLELAGGDLLVFLYGQISDSGVQVLRLDPKAGKAVWQTRCAPLGVTHSKYHHQASVAVTGGHVRVVSRGSFGSFTELLDLKTGQQVKRSRE
jgi:outer membrane protein assembly factor BamB